MKKGVNILKKWILDYLRSRNAMKKEIREFREEDDHVVAVYADKTRKFHMLPEIPEDFLLDNHMSIVTFNTKKSFDWMIARWNKLILYDDISIYFINPFVSTEQKWSIFPSIHNRISDNQSLQSGLKTLFSSVERVKESEVSGLAYH